MMVLKFVLTLLGCKTFRCRGKKGLTPNSLQSLSDSIMELGAIRVLMVKKLSNLIYLPKSQNDHGFFLECISLLLIAVRVYVKNWGHLRKKILCHNFSCPVNFHS